MGHLTSSGIIFHFSDPQLEGRDPELGRRSRFYDMAKTLLNSKRCNVMLSYVSFVFGYINSTVFCSDALKFWQFRIFGRKSNSLEGLKPLTETV